MVAKFLPAKPFRRFPRFWEKQWHLDTSDPFFSQTKPPYFFVPTVNPKVLLVWGEEIAVKPQNNGNSN